MAKASNTNPILDTMKGTFKECGFKKSRKRWWRALGETTLVVDLQSSQWSNAYYVNIGIWFNAAGPLSSPRPELCHLHARVFNSRDVQLALDLEASVEAAVEHCNDAPAWRGRVVRRALAHDVLPLVARCRTYDDVQIEMRHGILRRFHPTGAGYRWFNPGPRKPAEVTVIVPSMNWTKTFTVQPTPSSPGAPRKGLAAKRAPRDITAQARATAPPPAAELPDPSWIYPEIRHVSVLPAPGSPEVCPDHARFARPLVGDLLVTYVVDHDLVYRGLTKDDVLRLGLTPERLHEVAVANFRRRMHMYFRGQPPAFGIETGEEMEACVMLLDDIWPDLAEQVPGELLVGVPLQGYAFVTGSDSDQGLMMVRKGITDFNGWNPVHDLSKHLFVRRGTHWEVFP